MCGILRRIRFAYEFNQRNRDAWVAKQASLIPAGQRVLDAGAGTGVYRALFSHCEYRTQDFGKEPSTVGRYTALDYESDITAIPVPDGSFDVILCTEVLEHVPEPIKVLQEFSRILCPGGRLLITAPLGCRLHQEPYHFYGGYTPHWYQKFLPEAGFSLRSLERNNGFFSHFGQEGVHFSNLIDPRNTGGRKPAERLLLAGLWVLTLPFLRLMFPLLGPALDRLNLEQGDTVEYWVIAGRRE